MTASYIQNQFADRLGGDQFGKDTKIYKFEKIKRAKRAALTANPGKELFDLGVGEPDAMADSGVVNVLKLEAEKPENRGYTDNGVEEFKIAAIRYMEKTFGIQGLDPQKHVNHSIGSKPALAMTPSHDHSRLSGDGDTHSISRRPGGEPAPDGGKSFFARP